MSATENLRLEQVPIEFDNQAGRLLAVFKAARSHSDSKKCIAVWANTLQLFDVPESPAPEHYEAVLKKLVSLLESLGDVEAAMRDHRPDNYGLYTQAFPTLRDVLAPGNLTVQWQRHKGNLSDMTLGYLTFCAMELPKEGEISQDDLVKVQTEIEELFKQVLYSDIRSPLKNWLLELLSAAKKSIDDFMICGAKGFRKSAANVLGSIVLYKAEFLKEKEGKTWIDRFGRVFNSLVWLATKAEEAKPLIDVGKTIVAGYIGGTVS